MHGEETTQAEVAGPGSRVWPGKSAGACEEEPGGFIEACGCTSVVLMWRVLTTKDPRRPTGEVRGGFYGNGGPVGVGALVPLLNNLALGRQSGPTPLKDPDGLRAQVGRSACLPGDRLCGYRTEESPCVSGAGGVAIAACLAGVATCED
ncbi:hypothetical protein NDU88_004604 [Pleurodeles waltl]|uniref:Uncharacterized protein n=1 Tax=Pleurodeles waltl TaxID=8319 RepID=A0AAV7WWD4_PLEWA|nr:hypothetical protein NDU88_004604 [Pleurodeles waltl]